MNTRSLSDCEALLVRQFAHNPIGVSEHKPFGRVVFQVRLEHDRNSIRKTSSAPKVNGSSNGGALETKFVIAKAFVEAKIARSLQVLDWAEESHDIAREIRATRLEASKLRKATTVADLRITEGGVDQRYWAAYCKAMPQRLEFHFCFFLRDQLPKYLNVVLPLL
jgi:hypothetical protein